MQAKENPILEITGYKAGSYQPKKYLTKSIMKGNYDSKTIEKNENTINSKNKEVDIIL
jgi:hypothetical protein